MAAYRTYSKCGQDVAVAVFDDSQYKHSTFKQTLDANEGVVDDGGYLPTRSHTTRSCSTSPFSMAPHRE